MSQFIYLLNAFEAASQHNTPAEVGYAAKRKALLEYVEKLESARPEALRSGDTPRANACAAVASGRDIEQQDYYRMLDLARELERDLTEVTTVCDIEIRQRMKDEATRSPLAFNQQGEKK